MPSAEPGDARMIGFLRNLLLFNRPRNRGRAAVLAAMPDRAVCAELGVWKGEFSTEIAARNPVQLHLIDPWHFEPALPNRWYGGALAKSQADMDTIMQDVAHRFRNRPNVTIHRGKSLDIARQFPDRHFDWIYIDGDHSYQAVLDDLETWQKKMKRGGVICLDDYPWRDESGRQSVKDAIETFLQSYPAIAGEEIGGQFIIRANA
jgi:hypothetical protein